MSGQNSPRPHRTSPTQADKPPWWRPWAAPSVILIALGLVAAGVGALFNIHKEIASVEVDIRRVEVELGEKIHKESTEIREQVGENAKAIGRLEGEVSGLKREVSDLKTGVKGIDDKLDRVLKTGQGEVPPSEPPVKHSQRR